jgi:methylenetetrahydrofolate reductase (NADPH)
MSVHDRSSISRWRHLLKPGTRINITAFPGQLPADTADTARAIRAAGFSPVPHIAARTLASKAALQDLLGRLQDLAEVDEVFLIAGDRAAPIGSFATASDVLRTHVLERYGIVRVGVAGHPEKHPHVSDEVLRQATLEKAELVASLGLELKFITQFAFSSGPILHWVQRLRTDGIRSDVSIGIAGPAQLTTLLKFAAR